MVLDRMIMNGSGGAVEARSPFNKPEEVISSLRAGLNRLESGAISPPPIKVGEVIFWLSMSSLLLPRPRSFDAEDILKCIKDIKDTQLYLQCICLTVSNEVSQKLLMS